MVIDWMVPVLAVGGYLAGFVQGYYVLFEQVGHFLAPFATLAAGAYAIYQKWLYAEKNMHLRLKEYLSREEMRLRKTRNELSGIVVRPGPAHPFQTALFSRNSVKLALRRMGWRRPATALKKIKRASDELQRQLETWDDQETVFKTRKANANLVLGALAAARASAVGARNGDGRSANLAALGYFEEAYKLDPTASDALEYIGHQRVRLEDFDGAIYEFQRLADRAAENKDRLCEARALKFQAEVWEARDDSSPRNANGLLIRALDSIPLLPMRTEEAELFEMKGRVCEAVPNWGSEARLNYTEAERLYDDIELPEAKQGLNRVREAMQRIRMRQGPPPNVILPESEMPAIS